MMHLIDLPLLLFTPATWWGEEWRVKIPPIFLFLSLCLLPLNVVVGGDGQRSVGGGGQKWSKAMQAPAFPLDFFGRW